MFPFTKNIKIENKQDFINEVVRRVREEIPGMAREMITGSMSDISKFGGLPKFGTQGWDWSEHGAQAVADEVINCV